MTNLPPGWIRASIDEIAEVQGGIQKQPKRRPRENPAPFLRVANVLRGRLDLEDVHSVELFDGELERYVLRYGDLLVVEGNGSPEQIGRAAMWRDEISGSVHQNHLIRVRPTSAVLPKYLALAWNSPDIAGQLRDVASSTSGLYTLSTTKIKSIVVPVPPIREQGSIVATLEDHLSRVEVADSQLDAIARRTERYRDQVLISVGTGWHDATGRGAQPPSPAGVIDGDLPAVPAAWRWTRLQDIADVVGGVTKDAKKQSDPSVPEYPYLRVANVQRGRLDLTNVTSIRVPEAKAAHLRLRGGDVLLNEGGDRDKLGRGWIWEGQLDRCIHQNHVFRARIRDGVLHPKLLAWHANGFGKRWCEANGTQSVNLASISLSKIKNLPVPVPPAVQQASLVAAAETYLSILDRCELLIAQARANSVRLRRSLLFEAFAGRLASQDPEDEPASVLLERIRQERRAHPKPQRRRRTAPVSQEEALL
jgi:type I restriction enzyme S subunit